MNPTRPSGEAGDLRDASAGDLLNRLTTNLSTLVSEEIRLAQAEGRAALRQAAEGGALLAAGGLAGGVGVLLVGIGACRAVSRVLPEPLAYSLVGSAFLAGSAALGLAGTTELADLDLLPHTRQSLEDTGRRVRSRLHGPGPA